MRMITRLALCLAVSLVMLFGSASVASARDLGGSGDPLCDRLIRCGPCPPGTTDRIGPVCYGGPEL